MHDLNLGNNVTVFSFFVVGVFPKGRLYTVEPLYNEALGITNYFLPTSNSKMYEKKVDVTKPRYREQILLVPWPFFISRFHSNLLLLKCLFILLFASFTES